MQVLLRDSIYLKGRVGFFLSCFGFLGPSILPLSSKAGSNLQFRRYACTYGACARTQTRQVSESLLGKESHRKSLDLVLNDQNGVFAS